VTARIRLLFSFFAALLLAAAVPALTAPSASAASQAVAQDRLHLIQRKGYAGLAPDLVAEVLSPDDRPTEVLAKIAAWLSAGTRLAWVVDQRREEARVYRPDGSVSVVPADGSLDGEDVLPGFTCRLGEIMG